MLMNQFEYSMNAEENALISENLLDIFQFQKVETSRFLYSYFHEGALPFWLLFPLILDRLHET